MRFALTAQAQPTLADAIWPRGGAHRFLRTMVLIGFGALLIAISAKIKVPFHPVPMTLQTLAIATIAAALGARLAVGTVLAYLGAGLAGLPVFTNTPPEMPGLFYMIGPTGGICSDLSPPPPSSAASRIAAGTVRCRGFSSPC